MVTEKNPGNLRLLLTRKAIKMLEKLLVLDLYKQEAHISDVDHTRIILKLIEKMEGFKGEQQVQTEIAWKNFQEYYRLRKQEGIPEAGDAKDVHCNYRRRLSIDKKHL